MTSLDEMPADTLDDHIHYLDAIVQARRDELNDARTVVRDADRQLDIAVARASVAKAERRKRRRREREAIT